MELTFTKMHGLGNDFIVIDDRAGALDLSPEAVMWLTDRHFGIGADGLILVRRPTVPGADVSWWFRNADGSVAEMCGNGIRCLAKYVVDRGLVDEEAETVTIETALGLYEVRFTRDADGRLATATVDMGEPVLAADRVPVLLSCDTPGDPVIDCDLETSLGAVRVTCVSMGNPHCVIFVDDVDGAPVETLGPEIEHHPVFPNRTNVEFAEATGTGVIRLRVWERGVGETLACGTGACAATVAAALTCRGGRDATVELPGGTLEIHWSPDGRVLMTGPAREVFSGTVIIPEDPE